MAQRALSNADIEGFVKQQSAVVRAALEDDAAAPWTECLPPAAEIPYERCMQLLAVLRGLQTESLATFRICHIRHVSLFAALDGCAEGDFADMRHIAEYLQLPPALSLRIDQHAAAAKQRGLDEASSGALRLVLDGHAILAPLFQSAVAVGAYFDPSVAERGEPCGVAFREGLCDDAWDPLVAAGDDDGDAGAGVGVGASQALASGCADDRDAPAYAAYIAGRVAAGHSLPTAAVFVAKAQEYPLPILVASGCNLLRPLRALLAAGWAWGSESPCAAAKACNVEVLQLMWSSCARGDRPARFERVLPAAVRAGRLPVVQWLTATLGPSSIFLKASVEACRCGNMGILQWLTDTYAPSLPPAERPALTTTHLECAARRGDLEMVRYLLERGAPLGSFVTAAAAGAGSIAVLAFLRALGPPCSWSSSAFEAAAGHGNLSTLQWLLAQTPPCPFDVDTAMLAAAEQNRSTLLDWLAALRAGGGA
jgi:hypothetical protein